MSKKGSSDVFVSVALGSRDRSFSIWSTDLKRPLVVINDVFDQSVLDLSWSKDGKVRKMDQSPLRQQVPEAKSKFHLNQLCSQENQFIMYFPSTKGNFLGR